jgi:hypothetical protein
MPVGSSGRIVIEINPELKQKLYEQLNQENLNLKQWFLRNVDMFLNNENQLDLCFDEELNNSHNNTAITKAK